MALSDRVVTKAGFQLVIKSGTVGRLVRQAVLESLDDIAKNYKKQVDKNVSLDDHTLDELRSLGYPYSVTKPENELHDDRLVHEQTGELRKSIKTSTPEETSSRRFSVYVTTNSPYAPFLIYGTSRMRPRKFHEKAFEDIKEKYWNPLIERLKKLNYKIPTGATSARLIGK